MDFPLFRHIQRYEYILHKGYVYRKMVVDVGCGEFPSGSYTLALNALLVFAVDPLARSLRDDRKVVVINEDIFDFCGKVDVCVVCEVFEHMPEPGKFMKHLSGICRHAFITTPLAEFTSPTRNLQHVAEYSARDFDGIVEEGFEILDKKYQLANLSIVDRAEPAGDSLSQGHVVQMVWARSRNARE